MAQISNSNLQSILDKMARWGGEADGIPLASAISTAAVYTATSPTGGLTKANSDVLALLLALASGFSDVYQQQDFEPPANDLNVAQPLGGVLYASLWSAMRKALDKHAARYNAVAQGDLSALDALLRILNTSAITLRASGLFQQYFGGISVANMFTPTPFVLATVTATAAATATFAHVASIALSYGPGQIALLNTKSGGNTSTATITVTCTKSGVATSVAITAGATTYDYLTAATDTSQTYTDCTALVSISGATAGDTYALVILPDRTVNAA
jgi:hypothetical protein